MSIEDQDRRRAQILREITKAVRDLREEFPGRYLNWTAVANRLNDRGVRTLLRKTWTGEYLREYCSSRLPEVLLDQTEKQVYTAQNGGSESSESKGTTSALDDEEMRQVRQMLNEFRKRSLTVGDLTTRPKFRNPRKNSGIRCNEEILKRATAKAKEKDKETGGNLSSLIELLLWEFIGRPDDVVQSYEFHS